jgi:hypothetical protein
VLQPARYLLGRRQDKGVTARRCRLNRPEHPVRDVHKLAELGKVPAHQGEVVPLVKLADRPDPADAVLVTELAAQRVAGVRRVGDHTTRTNDTGDLDDRPRLRTGRMDVEVPGHPTSIETIVPARDRGTDRRLGPVSTTQVARRTCTSRTTSALLPIPHASVADLEYSPVTLPY